MAMEPCADAWQPAILFGDADESEHNPDCFRVKVLCHLL